MSSAGGAPPPPPPPFKFPGMVTHQPKPPPSVVSEPPPTMAAIQKAGMPAALAGAMMKDKKPFTYTPGGLDLSEIKSPRMQRRLQRNASLEGVKPSPLAQQTSPTNKSSSPLPPQGMIQVLPMPGVGMAPVVKSQAKETPKSKRTVCGPPPLPPPFACGVGDNAELKEKENKIPNHTNKNIISNESHTDVPPCPKAPSKISPNGFDSEGSTEQNHFDNKTNDIPNAPPPPPIPPTNTRKVNRESKKEKVDNLLDLTELEDTINSFSTKSNNREDPVSEIAMAHSPEENGVYENVVDCISEVTDCSSPFYPDEQNSIQNPSDQSQDIASSSDADHFIPEVAAKNEIPHSNRWYSDRVDDDTNRTTIKSETNTTPRAYYEDLPQVPSSTVATELNKGNRDMSAINVQNAHPMEMTPVKSIAREPEVLNIQLVDDGLKTGQYSNNEPTNCVKINNEPVVTSPHTNDVRERNTYFERQASLPVNQLPKVINRSLNNDGVDTKYNNYESQQNSYEKQSLEMDKPLPWMVGMKKEQSPTPDFIHRANKAQQNFQRQRSLPQSNETQYQSAPWRHPHHRSPNTLTRNRSISPTSTTLCSGGQLYSENQPSMNDGYGPAVNHSHYATLPSMHRNKNQQMHFQNSTAQSKPNAAPSQHRERIIPIMLEASPPVTPQCNVDATNLSYRNTIPNNFNNQQNVSINSYTGNPYSPEYPNSAMSFTPFSPTSPYSLNTTEALHQIQHNLNKLNNGLKNEETYEQNGSANHQGVNVHLSNDNSTLQSKSFNTIQKAYETPSSTDSNAEEPRKYTGSNIPSRSFKALQAMTDSQGYNQNHSSS